jgi:hypothetical protein
MVKHKEYTSSNLQITPITSIMVGWFMVFNATFQQYFSYIVAVSFIGGGNWRKPPTCRKSWTNFIT